MNPPKKLPGETLRYKIKKASSEDYVHNYVCQVCGSDTRDLPELLSHIAALDEKINKLKAFRCGRCGETAIRSDALPIIEERDQLRAENEQLKLGHETLLKAFALESERLRARVAQLEGALKFYHPLKPAWEMQAHIHKALSQSPGADLKEKR